MHPILKNSLIGDSEATSLRSGAGVLEFTLFDIESRTAEEWILKPNLVKLHDTLRQDPLKLATGPLEKYENVVVSSWKEAIAREQLDMLGLNVPEKELLSKADEVLSWNNSFLYKAIEEGRLPQITGAAVDNADRIALLSRFGVNFVPGRSPVSMERLLADILPSKIEGKTLWFANAPYDSRILGAHAGALGLGEGLKKTLESQNPNTPAPFYVTGKEVIAARTAANITGDWSQVWKAYKAHTPKAGETAVRDILDVVRATISYGKDLGYLKGDITFHGLGIDITSKMYAKAFGDTAILALPEAHRSLEDAAIHQHYVLTRAVDIADVLQNISENTQKGRQYISLAQQGAGPLTNILKVFKMQEGIQQNLHRKALIQRLGRAYENFFLEGEIVHNTGGYKIITQDQIDYSGNAVKVVMNYPDRRRHTSMANFLDWLSQQDDVKTFGLDVHAEYDAMINYARSTDIAEVEGVSREFIGVKRYVDGARNLLDVDLSAVSMKPDIARLTTKIDLPKMNFKLPDISSRAMTRIGGVAAAATMASLMWDAVGDVRRGRESKSVLTYNYQMYLDQMEGMPETGIAGSTRSANTDFGSPYQGPVTSQQVLLNQELLEEREKWLSKEYHIRHFDPQAGLFGLGSVFRLSGGYTYFQDGQAVETGYRGLTGQNMMSLNLKDGWKITAEDADTIVLRRKGLLSSMSAFFGFDRSVSVRLAGIDSPELSHGGRTFGGSQPYADQAKQIIAEKIARAEDLEIVYSATDTSYGRVMGALFTDGRNLNYELVKEGAATHLSYGKAQDAMINYKELADIERIAFEQKRGFWQNSYGQLFYQITEAAGHRPTLNTLANKAKIVENSSYMELVSALEQTRNLGTSPVNWDNVITGIASRYDPFSDNVKPSYYNAPASSYKNALWSMKSELSGMMRTSGSNQNKSQIENSRLGLNQALAIDSLGTTNSVFTRRKTVFNDTYGIDKINNRRTKLAMAENHNMTMQNIFNSQVNHHRML